MLRVEQVCKSYGARQVLRSISLTCQPGAYMLRGPNGVGKSTLLRVLAGVTPPDSGAVWIDGHALHQEPIEAKLRLAYAPDECPIYPFITGSELLAFVARARRCTLTPQVHAVVERFGLDRHLGTRCGDMSLGTQKKLMLAAAWIGELHHTFGVEHLLGELRDGECVELLRSASEGRESHHEEMEPRGRY